ncbi:hypothetical protein [Oricola sp.]|uniref:hypothetical protein n=1 Tax=Oricola sp. TaxID=1979950 RepID=UPI0025F78F60|nr:hypothetical protein [Oricola sp.]MCI5075680.1 hypothetical protein [Oricola sp.]
MDDASTVVRLRDVTLRLGEGPLRYERENRAAIDANWARLSAANPRLWNGPFFLFEAVSLTGDALSGTARRTDFATFLYWRDHGKPGEATHITGSSMPVMADGALFAVRMGAHTANAGQVYFPGGSFDADDVIDGSFDVTRNLSRELVEETGLVFREAEADADFTAARGANSYHIARRNRLPFGFVEGVERLRRHQAVTGDDEIETAVAVHADWRDTVSLKPHAGLLADWHFANG